MNARSEIVREGKLRIARQRLLEQRQRLLAVLMRVANPAPAEKIARPHIKIIGLEVPRRRHLQASHFSRREIGLQRPNDPLGQFGLDGKKIGQFAIESLGPNMGVGPSVDQLRVHPHPIAGTSHRAFQHMGNAERFADLAQVARPGSILLHRGAADHFQVGDLAPGWREYRRARRRRRRCSPGRRSGFRRAARRCFSPAPPSRSDPRRRRILGPLDPGGSDIVGPGQDDCDRETRGRARG